MKSSGKSDQSNREKQVIKAINERKDELFALLGDLIRIDSQNFRTYGHEQACAEYIAGRLNELGLAADVYSPDAVAGLTAHPDYLSGRSLGNRPDVTACLPGLKSDRRLMLAAHSDTMPIGSIDKWSFPPLSGEQLDGRIRGRGACDDKYGIAAILFILRLLRDLDIRLDYDLLFTAYSDEEYGGGNGTLASCLKYPCDDVLNLDCKDFEIWNCAIGGGEIKATVRSKKPADSCAAAVDGLMRVKEAFLRFKDNRRREIAADPHYRGTNIPDTSVRFMHFTAGEYGSDLDTASLIVTYYTTKTAAEIDEELASMAADLKPELDNLGLELVGFEPATRFFHFAPSEENNPVIAMLDRAAARTSGRSLVSCGACLSDLSLFIKYGSPRAISFGIGRDFNVYGGAHQTDEFIECDRLVEFTGIVAAFLMEYH
ncbi:MAG: M20/M25/M40 family metallo-hydrolase [Clostridiaceae bacterium]|nr:M20/M25/M40 family metallo-hydrolase [Clostridiaceae bacterium]